MERQSGKSVEIHLINIYEASNDLIKKKLDVLLSDDFTYQKVRRKLETLSKKSRTLQKFKIAIWKDPPCSTKQSIVSI